MYSRSALNSLCRKGRPCPSLSIPQGSELHRCITILGACGAGDVT